MSLEARGEPSSAPTPLGRELGRYVRYLALERGRSQNTIAAYRSDLERYFDFLHSLGVSAPEEISPQAVRTYVESLEGVATTVARKLSSIKNFHRYLVEENVLSYDPSAEIRPPSLPSRLPKALSISQVQALLDSVIGDDPVALRDRALLEFLYGSGARISEALELAVDDVLDDTAHTGSTVRVTGKGRKQRIVPLGSYARAALDAYLTRARPVMVARHRRPVPTVFVGVRGGALSRQSAWLILQEAAKRADLATLVSPHTLRHSFATHVLSGGADIRVVQELLGHASVSTTQIYTKVTIDTLREVYHSAHPRAR
jgi:integrase/recombinase XerD